MSAPAPRKRVAVLISGRGSNMSALLAAAQDPAYPAEIAFVMSNRPDAAGVDIARAQGVEAIAMDHKAHAGREAFERAMQAELEARNIDIVCLAGFMRLLTPWFIGLWTGRIVNIHPALLPSYRGLHTHERALADGVKIHGCTVHFVVPEMDEGPIVAQAAVPVLDDDDADSLGARVLAQEHVIYPRALALLAAGRLAVEGNRVRVAGGREAPGPLVMPQV